MPRRVMYHPDFDADCTLLGGITAVQSVIAPLVAALEDGADVGAFGLLLDVTTGIRWAAIKAVGGMAALIVTFEVDADDDVIMISVTART